MGTKRPEYKSGTHNCFGTLSFYMGTKPVKIGINPAFVLEPCKTTWVQNLVFLGHNNVQLWNPVKLHRCTQSNRYTICVAAQHSKIYTFTVDFAAEGEGD